MNTFSGHRKATLAAAVTAALLIGCPTSALAMRHTPASSASAQQDTQTTAQAQSTQNNKKAASQKQNGKKKATKLATITVSAGISGAETRAIQRKRFAPQIQDSISAEDIGKLPDATITDSLQRIPGVQIDRSAGEGSSLNVRGLPEVGTTLNGEVFLTADNIVSVQPNFADIPSQLFAGADVIKSPTASTLNNGITGTVNLRTRRPWDLKSGWTFAGSADGSHGYKTKKWQPEENFLASYNDDGQWGVLLSVAYSDLTHENSADGMDQYGGKLFGENAASATGSDGFLGAFGAAPIPSGIAQLGGGNVDVNGDGKADGAYYGSENFTALQTALERKRLGVNASVQAKLGSGLKFTGDMFFTRQNQYNRMAGYQLNSASWLGATFVPVVARDTGVTVSSPYNGGGWSPGQELYTTQVYKKWLGDLETYSEDDVTNSVSRNFNLQLNYDNGGSFTGDVRWVLGNAHEKRIGSYVQFTDADGTAWPNDPANAVAPGTYIYPSDLGGNRVFNPSGFAPNTVPVTVDMRGTHMAVSAPSSLTTFLADPNNYALKTISSEGNYQRESNMDIFRADGHYFFDSSNISLDFGLRNSIRTAGNVNFNYVAPVYAGDGASDASGCYVRWKAADVVLNGGGIAGACTAGNAQGYFRAGELSAQNPSQLPSAIADHMKLYTNVAGVKGISLYNLDPNVMDNPLAFQNSLYPGEKRNVDPGGTWDLFLKETTAYIQANFDNMYAALPYSGNVGVRVIRTDLNVTQHIVGAAQPYGLLAQEGGQTQSRRSYTDVLPAANLSLDFTPSLKLRLAYSKNMMPLNLNQWGGGLTLNYGIDTSTPGSTLFRVLGGSSAGNPQLDPWRSSNYGASLEYYGQWSTLSLAAFYVDVDSFIKNGTINRCDIPDQDGVIRRCVTVTAPIQGNGDTLHGFEFGYKQNFKFLHGFFSHFGIDANYTFSPSNTGTDLAGNSVPFQDNSKQQANLAIWYQDAKWQVRLAGNYRSKRAVSENYGGISGLEMYQAPTFYLAASISYKISKNVSVYAQGVNLTGEHERYYLVWPDQVAGTTQFEKRVMIGARVKF